MGSPGWQLEPTWPSLWWVPVPLPPTHPPPGWLEGPSGVGPAPTPCSPPSPLPHCAQWGWHSAISVKFCCSDDCFQGSQAFCLFRFLFRMK